MSRTAHGQTVAWGAAGIPLVIALVQTLLALFGYTSNSAGLTPIADPVLSIPVLFEAAVVFKDSSAVVMGLFLLIALAWAAQGGAMLLVEHREAAYGAATLSSVLFFALFFGVYAPLTSADVPLVQFAAFYAVPVCAAALQLFAVATYPWNEVVLEETGDDLGRLEADLANKRSAFDTAFDARFEGLETLSNVAPGGVRDVREGAEEFRTRLDGIDDDIAEVRTMSDGEAAQAARAGVESEIDGLDPEARIEELTDRLRQALASGIRTEYGEFVVRSEYGERYRTVNLPTKHREVSIPGGADAVHLDHVDEELESLTRSADSFGAVAAAVEAVDEHRQRVRAHVSEREAPVVEAISTAESRLDTLDDQIEAVDVPFRDRIDEVLVAGRDPDLAGARDVQSDLDRAREALHDCQFDDALSVAEDAAERAAMLVTTAELLSTLEATIDARHATVSIPTETPDEYIEAIVPAIRAGYDGVDATLDAGGGRITFTYDGVADGTVPATDVAAAGDTSSDDAGDPAGTSNQPDAVETGSGRESVRVAPPEEVVDGVLYAFREFERVAEGDDRIVQFRLEDLPDSVATRDVLVNVERFAGRQSDLFEAVDLQSPEPPGFIEFTPAEGESIERSMSAAHRRFREKYT
ncbi:hypothetical protein [Halobaculum roseum]|uniref:Uncharacterized protein n=1 Tax=Halobaculum roseum TaxID=2175149 RepID=A0ABD5MQ60_9EURY|nr:hypothetical protein [Halobaculum roseum]QZY04605.1 hypothetical protein K6T36_16745 [Halobaculum roseum]